MRSNKNNFRIKSIWITDVANQGQSGVLNEKLLGNDPSWSDHARDLLHLINIHRRDMPRPLVAIGHSLGGQVLCDVALMHPRLFATMVLIEPVLQHKLSASPNPGHILAHTSTYRRDIWPSRNAAAEGYKRSKFYQTWDPRVIERLVRFGLRDLPTLIYPAVPPGSGEQPVTLSTTKHQEVFTFLRPNYQGSGYNSRPVNRKTHPDVHPGLPPIYPFYRPEILRTFFRLPELRPSVFYMFGELSYLSSTELMEARLSTTGTGVGGSGGRPEGKVKEISLKGVGHLVPMEAVEDCADAASEWIGKEIQIWSVDEEEHRQEWSKKSLLEKQTIDKKWKEMVGASRPATKLATESKL